MTWESKYSLLIKFGQFMSYYKRKCFLKILQKLRPGNYFEVFLCLQKNSAQPLLENEIFEMTCLY